MLVALVEAVVSFIHILGELQSSASLLQILKTLTVLVSDLTSIVLLASLHHCLILQFSLVLAHLIPGIRLSDCLNNMVSLLIPIVLTLLNILEQGDQLTQGATLWNLMKSTLWTWISQVNVNEFSS